MLRYGVLLDVPSADRRAFGLAVPKLGLQAQMHVALGLKNNIGDITAKITSQSIAASLVGTACGIVMSHFTGESSLNVLAAFVPLSAVAVYANYKSNLSVRPTSTLFLVV